MNLQERMNQIINDQNDNFKYVMEDLLKKKAEYEDKLNYTNGNVEQEKYIIGARDGIMVAIDSLIKYIYPPEK